jgi:hypothetical protein
LQSTFFSLSFFYFFLLLWAIKAFCFFRFFVYILKTIYNYNGIFLIQNLNKSDWVRDVYRDTLKLFYAALMGGKKIQKLATFFIYCSLTITMCVFNFNLKKYTIKINHEKTK